MGGSVYLNNTTSGVATLVSYFLGGLASIHLSTKKAYFYLYLISFISALPLLMFDAAEREDLTLVVSLCVFGMRFGIAAAFMFSF